MMQPKGKVAVITGASSGIGAATARRLSQIGMRVVLVARRQERLSGLKQAIESEGGRAEVIPADLADENDRLRVYQKVESDYAGADVLVNNAGFGWYGYFSKMPWETARALLQVNIDATAHLTSLFLPGMRARDRGHIINLGSISGSIPSQGVALYSASKSFLDAFSTALHRELHGTQVQVSVVRAGPVRTEFSQTAAKGVNGLHLPTENIGVTAERVAGRICQLLQHPRRVIYVPRWLRIVPLFELSFGWLEDRLGPLLLKRQEA
jgi:short-subunit dehydrogenase